LFERLSCEIRLDHDYVAHVRIESKGRGAVSAAEIHDLDFGLALLPALVSGSTDDIGTSTSAAMKAAKPVGTAPIRDRVGAVAFRPNIVSADRDSINLRHTVAGDVARKFWPGMFSADAPDRTPRQHKEAMYYAPCAVCGRNAYQIEVEGAGPKCQSRCFQQAAPRRLAG
jgi:hypothetical protein